MEQKDMQPKLRRRFKIRIYHILILLLLLCFGAFIHFRVSMKDQIRMRIDSIHAQGYPVTCEELDQWYAIPENAENAAQVVLDAIDNYTEPNNAEVLPVFGKVELPSRTEAMPEDMKKLISQCLNDNTKCLESLHKTIKLEYGRYPINLSLGMATILPKLSEIKKCALLLHLEEVNSAENNDSINAVSSVESILGTAQTFSLEPVLVSQLVRLSIQNLAVSSLEYSINRISFTKEQLIELGRIFRSAENSMGMKLRICRGTLYDIEYF